MYEVAEGSDLPWTSSCPHCLGLSNYLSYQLIKGSEGGGGEGRSLIRKQQKTKDKVSSLTT